jgi:nucleoside-diphosphate-sugar epimerase
LRDRLITINNPAIWRPLIDVRDATAAYVMAVEADSRISGIFNIASGNYTVGEVAEYVRDGVKEYLGIEAGLNAKNIEDFRNYKVSTEKAQKVLAFQPRFSIKDTIRNLADNHDRFRDFDNPIYHNIQVFKQLDSQSVPAAR